MIIEIQINGRYKAQKEKLLPIFNIYLKRIKKTTKILSKIYKVKPPETLILRPLYTKNGNNEYYGRLIHDNCNGYQIAINFGLCLKRRDKGIEILDHECAHIIADLIERDLGHGKMFKEIYILCREIK